MKKPSFTRDFYFALLFGLIIGIGIGVFSSTILGVKSKNKVGEEVKKLYELSFPNLKVEVVDVIDKGSLYEVFLKFYTSPQPTFLEVFVTKDGKFLSENLIRVGESIRQIEKSKNFVDCLYTKGVRIYGISNSTATLLQLNLLGRYSGKLYVSCDGQNVQNCLKAGVSQVPSVVYEGKVYTGVKSVQWFENITGCKLE